MAATDPERALVRLEQLAREEQAAVDAEDVNAVCRISELLSDATARVLEFDYRGDARLAERIEAIQRAHRGAEALLALRLAETREALRQVGGGKRAVNGYGRGGPAATRVHSRV